MKYIYIPLNCSKCGRFVSKDGFTDSGYDAEGTPEIGYPLCERCLDERGPTIYELEKEIREIGTAYSVGAKERVAHLKKQIEIIRVAWRQ